MEGLYAIQGSAIKEHTIKKNSILTIGLFLFVLLSIIEAKQVKALFDLNITWFYPQYIVLTIMLLLISLLTKKLVINSFYIPILQINYLFSIACFISLFINYILGNIIDIKFSLQGLFKIFIQYLFVTTLLTIILSNWTKAIIVVMKSIIILSFLEIIFILTGIIGFELKLNLLPMQKIINNQIMSSSWLKVFSLSSFLPKFGGTFPETQALALFLLVAYISCKLLEDNKIYLHKITILWGKMLPIFIIITLSKTVIPALLFFLIWNYGNKKYLKAKIILTLLFIGFFIYFLIETYGYALTNYYYYAMKADSLGERIFHITNFFDYAKDNFLSFLLGVGIYNYGNIVQVINPVLFNSYTNAISVFTVLLESGFLGFTLYLFLWIYIISKSKNFLIRISLISLFIANTGQPNWSMDILLISIITIFSIGNIDKKELENI